MVISSVIVKCLDEDSQELQSHLETIDGLSVEKEINGDYIIVLESLSVDDAIYTIEKRINLLPGVKGAYPVYINMEEELLG